MDVKAISQYLEEARLYGTGMQEITGFSIDSRQLEPGHLFFALAGEKVDGHQFVAETLQKGASGAVVSRIPQEVGPEMLKHASLLVVPDVFKALQQMALSFRIQAGIPVVAITGSSGKTTTKDLVALVLKAKYRTLKTAGNFNNEIGLPLTLLGLREEHQVAVVEMGMRGLGQIRELCAIARPDYGIITNVGTAHFELLGSEEKIAQAKGELLYSLPDQGVAILNRDDLWNTRLGEELKKERPRLEVIYYGFHRSAQYRACHLVPVEGGTRFTVVAPGENFQEVFIPLPGSHNVMNALVALTIGNLFEVPLQRSIQVLATAVISEKRLAQVPGITGSTIIDDTYNANPESTIASLGVLGTLPASRKIAVLGTQRELGVLAEKSHRKVGEKVAQLGVDYLITVGGQAGWIADAALAKGMETERVYCLNTNQEAILLLQQLLQKGDLVLVKGSRALAMEKIVAAVALSEGGAGE